MGLELYAVVLDGGRHLVELEGNETEGDIVEMVAEAAGYKANKVELLTPVDEVMMTEMGGEFKVGYKWKPTREEATTQCLDRHIATGRSQLLAAAESGNIEVTQLIYIADPIPLVNIASELISRNNIDTLCRLVELGGDISTCDHDHETVLGYVVLSSLPSSAGTVSRLVELGADVNQPGSRGKTPLMYAALQQNPEMVRHLISLGAEIDATSSHGTAMHFAARKGNEDVIEALCEASGDINAATADRGNTPLHVASRARSSPAISTLIASGADPSILNVDRQTPLHTAALEGNVAAITGLLHHREMFDIYAVDNEGRTAMFYAMRDDQTQHAMLRHNVKPRVKDVFGATSVEGVIKCISRMF